MLQKLTKNRGGFTLVEIMIVVAIIALLAAIAVPNFLRARKRSQATRCLEDLRLIDAAIDQYAIDSNKKAGDSADWADVSKYLKTGTQLFASGGKDILGGDMVTGLKVDQSPVIPSTTWDALSDVADAAFWSPYTTGSSSTAP